MPDAIIPPLNPEEVAALEALCTRATPAPWTLWPSTSANTALVAPRRLVFPTETQDALALFRGDHGVREANAAFTAAARSALPRALETIRAAWAERDEALAAMSAYTADVVLALAVAKHERDAAEARVRELRAAAEAFLAERTIAEAVQGLSPEGRDAEFAAEVAEYRQDCESVTKVALALRAALDAAGARPIPASTGPTSTITLETSGRLVRRPRVGGGARPTAAGGRPRRAR